MSMEILGQDCSLVEKLALIINGNGKEVMVFYFLTALL